MVLLEEVGGLEGGLDVSGVTDKSDILTLSLNLGLSKGQNEVGDMASSDMGKDSPYMISFSRKTVTLGSRMAALSRPLASSEL